MDVRPPLSLPGSQFASALQLSVWHDVMGPVCLQLWQSDQHTGLSKPVIRYVARHTVDGDDALVLDEAEMQSKFSSVAHLAILTTAVVFSAPLESGVRAKHSLALIVPHEHLARYQVLHPIVEDMLSVLGARLTTLLKREEAQLDAVLQQFSGMLPELLTHLDTVFDATVPTPSFYGTVFSDKGVMQDPEFLARSMSSLLQTNGGVVVAGKSDKEVRRWVNTMSMILGPEAREQSSLRVVQYTPNLYVQGIVGVWGDDASVLRSSMPTTLIDLHRRVVRQTRPLHTYSLLRKDFLQWECHQLKHGRPLDDPRQATPVEVFRLVSRSAPSVRSMLLQMSELPLGVREAYLYEWTRLQTRSAVVMIKFVESLLARHNKVGDADVKALRRDLELDDFQDFYVMVGIAERLDPGIYAAIKGDPEALEEKVMEFLDAF